MEQVKKLVGILLAAVMVLAMCTAAFAEEAPSTAAVSGETYTAYKIFDKTSSEGGTSYTLDANSPWVSVLTADEAKTYVTVTEAAGGGYAVTWVENADAAAFANYLKTNIPTEAVKTEQEASETTTTFSSLAEGYYLITSTLGATLATTNGSGDITIVEKNTKPDVDKTIANTDAYAQIGSTIGYTVTVDTGSGANQAITLTDTMSSSLTLDKDSFVVKVGDAEVGTDNYTLNADPETTDTWTFKIVFSEAYVKSLAANTKIVVTYSATLNGNAVSVDGTNTAKIDYSHQTDTSTTTTKTNSFSVLKYAFGDGQKAVLAGATFQLKQDNGVVKLIKVGDTAYRVANGDETNAVETFTTVSGGKITIQGVDSDLTYTLVETVAPSGYNLLTAPVSVAVDADNKTVSEIANSAGASLPTTGGMGTTLFYVVGAILVLGAGVLLVTRRRMSE